MAEYISTKALGEFMADFRKNMPALFKWTELLQAMSKIPRADVVEVVRCKDCIHASMTFDGTCKYCAVWYQNGPLYLDGDYYCADGERKNDV